MSISDTKGIANPIHYYDKNDVIMGVAEVLSADGFNSFRINIRNKTNTSWAYAVELRIYDDGTSKFMVPSPTASDNSNAAAPTAWVNSRITSIMNSAFKLDVSKKQSIDTSFTAPSAGILSVRNTSKGTYTVTIDEVEVARSFFYDSQDTTSIVIPIGAGQKAEITFKERFFIPYSII